MTTRRTRVLSGSALAAGVLVLAGASPAGASAGDCKSDGTPLGDITTGICQGLEDTRKGIEDATKRITDGGEQKKQSGDGAGDQSGAKSGSTTSKRGDGAGDQSGSKSTGGNGAPAGHTTGTRLRPPVGLIEPGGGRGFDPDAPPSGRRPARPEVVLPEVAGREAAIPRRRTPR